LRAIYDPVGTPRVGHFLIAREGTGVAHGAHIGGFLAGTTIAGLMRTIRR
jgi:membrane associated rhomboid family serine protease